MLQASALEWAGTECDSLPPLQGDSSDRAGWCTLNRESIWAPEELAAPARLDELRRRGLGWQVLAAARGLRDGAPVCRRYSEIAVGRALGRAAVGGRPARARCAGPGGRRRAAGAGGGRRRCSAETRSPSPRPRVPAQLPLASGTAHLQVRKLGWGLHGDLALPRAGSRRELGDSQG